MKSSILLLIILLLGTSQTFSQIAQKRSMQKAKDNKDRDTHWSCGVFDQNEKQVTDFHDNSDNDEYIAGSTTGPLKMNMDNSVLFSQFGNGGHVHINIAPNGNDTWEIAKFTLTLDFVNPKLSQTISWPAITLSQDHRVLTFI